MKLCIEVMTHQAYHVCQGVKQSRVPVTFLRPLRAFAHTAATDGPSLTAVAVLAVVVLAVAAQVLAVAAQVLADVWA